MTATENYTEQQKAEAINSIYNDKVVGNFTKSELDTLRNTIARGTDDSEFRLFVQTCVNTGLNPFLNHIHCMVYDGKNGRQLSIQISSEGILYLARKSKGFKGIDAQMVHEKDDFRIDMATKKIVKHEIGFPRGRIVGGYCIARHEDFEDKVLLMDVAEVEHMTKGRNSIMWNTWFADMFKKHMLKRVAKEQYGIDLTENEISSEPTSHIESYQEKPRTVQISEEETVSIDDKVKELWSEINNNAPESVVANCMTKYFKGKTQEQMELKDVVALKKFTQLEIAQMNKAQMTPKEPEIVEVVEIEEIPQPPMEPANEFDGYFD